MTADTKPSIDTLRRNIDQQPEVLVIGEIVDNRSWEEWRRVYIAPRKPAYDLRSLNTVYDIFRKQGFEDCSSPYEDDKYLHVGSINFDEGNKRRLLISAFPDIEITRETFEWDQAWHEGKGPELRNKYKAEGKKEPMSSIPLDTLDLRWLKYQVNRLKSVLRIG